MESGMRAGLCGCLILILAASNVAPAQQAVPPQPAQGIGPPDPRGLAPLDPEKLPPPKDMRSGGGASQTGPAGPTKGPGDNAMPSGSDASCSAPMTGDRREALHDDHIGPDENFWFRGSYLLWWIKPGPLEAPLVTTGSTAGRGALGLPDTTVLFGNSKFDYGSFNGFQLESGLWLDHCHIWGFEAGGFLLEKKATTTTFSSDANGNPLLARPATNTVTIPVPVPFGFLVAFPNAFAGSITVSSSSRLWGANADFIRNLAAMPNFRADLLFGFRYLDLGEDLTISQATTVLPRGTLVFTPDPNATRQMLGAGSTVSILDRFQTRNRFYGGQIGGRVEYHWGSYFINVISKVALGPSQESLDISGVTTATGVTATAPGGTTPSGFLALAGSNGGLHSTNWFVIAPEVNLQVGYQLSNHLLAHIGYDFLYINNVVRPGNEVNLNVNPTFVPTSASFIFPSGLPQPRVLFRHEDFWAHGLQLGVEVRF
jgi:hypothetical protein